MGLKDYIKSNGGSPVSNKSNPFPRSLSKSLSINSNYINTIIWYLRTRKADDKSCELLHQISGASTSSYMEVSPIFIVDMKKFIEELREKVKLLDIKDGCVNIKFENNDENFNVKQMSSCIKLFFKDALTFFGKDVQYDNILII
jgi:hypothetical protein